MKPHREHQYLKVTAGETYISNQSNWPKYLMCYDENQKPTTLIKRNKTSNSFTVPEGTHYISLKNQKEMTR